MIFEAEPTTRIDGEISCDPDMPLVQAVRDGNASAFEELVKRYDRQLFRIAQGIVHHHEDAQDIVQESFIKAFTRLGQFQGKSRFSTWLVRIALNQALMKARGAKRKLVSIEPDPQKNEDRRPREIADWAPNPEMLYRNSELRTILERCLQKLTPGLRAVFLLRDVEGLSIEEVCHALNLTGAAVKTRTLRARMRLRKELSGYFQQNQQGPKVGVSRCSLLVPSSNHVPLSPGAVVCPPESTSSKLTSPR